MNDLWISASEAPTGSRHYWTFRPAKDGHPEYQGSCLFDDTGDKGPWFDENYRGTAPVTLYKLLPKSPQSTVDMQLVRDVILYLKGHYGSSGDTLKDLRTIIVAHAHFEWHDRMLLEVVHCVYDLVCRDSHLDVVSQAFSPLFRDDKTPFERYVAGMCGRIAISYAVDCPRLEPKGTFRFT